MANKFAIILAMGTLVTGIIWCFERFKWAPARQAKIAAINAQAADASGNKTQATLEKQPNWVETCASVFPVLALVFMVRSFVYEPFQIPSGSMMPTLLIGDFILVEKYAYGIKDPITQTTLIETGRPKRGDIAVFKYPLDPSLDYIKRVVGLPGDRVSYDPINKRITVEAPCREQPCDTVSVTYHQSVLSDFVQTFSQGGAYGSSSTGFSLIPSDQPVSEGALRLREHTESIGAASHHILTMPGTQDQMDMYYQQPNQPLGVWVVPDDHYFMMGDNRDYSSDGRYWGFVPAKNLVGKATAIWMSFKKQEGEWPTGVRFSRIGEIH